MHNTFTEPLKEKLKEALQAVLPIMGLVLVLCFSVAPISSSILLCFLLGGAMLIAGMMFFTLGAEVSMTPMGERVGTAMTKSRKVWLMLLLAFLLCGYYAVHLIVEVQARYRYFLLPTVFLLAGYGLAAMEQNDQRS